MRTKEREKDRDRRKEIQIQPKADNAFLHLQEFSETAAVVVSHGLCITECLQHRVCLKHALLYGVTCKGEKEVRDNKKQKENQDTERKLR